MVFVLCFVFVFIFLPVLKVMVRKTKAKKTLPPPPLLLIFLPNNDAYEKLNIFRSVWAGRKVILDKVNLEIHRNFGSRGRLPLLDLEHPLSAALIREFYLNLSIHTDDSNIHFVKT